MIFADNKILELSPGVYVIPGTTNIGIITDDKGTYQDVFIIDSGNTEIDGEYILEVLENFFKFNSVEYKIKAIINTHSHADHTGGNAFIYEKTHCEIWAAADSRGEMLCPFLHTGIVWGANPPKDINTVYYRPDPSVVTDTIFEGKEISLSENRTLSFIFLPGHSFDCHGIICTDSNGKKTLFAGDCIFPYKEIGHFSIPLTTNHIAFIESLDKIQAIENLEWCIPGHGDFISKNIEETIETDKIAIMEIEKCILNIIGDGKATLDETIQKTCNLFEISLNIRKYALIEFTIKSFLTTLRNSGKLQMIIEDNILYWAKK